MINKFLFIVLLIAATAVQAQQKTSSLFLNANGSIHYVPDSLGNTIPDFSNVGYYEGNAVIPGIPVVKTIGPSANDSQTIQKAIDELAATKPGKDGFRGVILLQKGTYTINGTIKINVAGIILRGEGTATKLIALGNKQHTLISVTGSGSPKEITGTREKILDNYVPTGAKSFKVGSTAGLKKGDRIMLLRPGTDQWIKDLKMDQIVPKEDTKQWTAAEYDLAFERIITKISGNTIFIDNPVVMAMEAKYGGGEIYKYEFDGRINKCAVENLYLESAFESDTAENHGWDAISFNRIENGWIKNVTARYFGYSCVNLGNLSKWITVDSCKCLDAKSQVIGGRRYSFNNDGQMNLFINCYASEGRHDYVTGAKVAGPNVFYNCTAEHTHADIGPHHRWAMGTLYDNIISDGEINAQDRGNWGTGHGWSGVTQVFYHCTASKAAIQDPYVSGKNYCIGLKAIPYEGRFKGRPATYWQQFDEKMMPFSLFFAQLRERSMK